MSNANMILATVDVLLEDKMETPKQHLEPGEHIVTRVVELDKLQAELEGALRLITKKPSRVVNTTSIAYDKRVRTFPLHPSTSADQNGFEGICCRCASFPFRCRLRSCEGDSVILNNREIIAKVTNM